jgi:hypothetical protein
VDGSLVWVPKLSLSSSIRFSLPITAALNWLNSKSQIYVTTDGQSASLSWCQAPSGTQVAGLLMWVVLSDERMGLSFTIAAGPRQRSHSRARVPRDFWPYFLVSDFRFLQPGTWFWVLCYDRWSVGQSVSEQSTHSGLTARFFYCQTVAYLLMWGASSDERTVLLFTIVVGPHQRSHSRVPSPMCLTTIFYCLRFETSLFVASYYSQGYDGGSQPRLHTG